MLFPRTIIVRSASVCGYSPNMRFDTTVNMMTNHAIRKGEITVNGGRQKRSHVHIKDICDFYKLLLKAPKEKIGQAFNVVLENKAVAETANTVAEVMGCIIVKKPHSDDRSYTVDGTKAREILGFTPKHSVWQAVRDMVVKLKAGYWPDSLTNPIYQRHGL